MPATDESYRHCYETYTKIGLDFEPYVIVHLPDRSNASSTDQSSTVRHISIIKLHDESEAIKIFIGGNIPGKKYSIEISNSKDFMYLQIKDGPDYEADGCGFIRITIDPHGNIDNNPQIDPLKIM